MESIKESIKNTKNVLADWNIVNKKENTIQIDIQNKPNAEPGVMETGMAKATDQSLVELDFVDSKEFKERCEMIDIIYKKVETMEEKINNLESRLNEESSLNSLNDSSLNTTNVCNVIYPFSNMNGLRYLTYPNIARPPPIPTPKPLTWSPSPLKQHSPNQSQQISNDPHKSNNNSNNKSGVSLFGIKLY